MTSHGEMKLKVGGERMTGAGEDGEREAQCAVEGWVIGLVGRFGLVGGFRHPGSLSLHPSSDIYTYIEGWRERSVMRGLVGRSAMRGLVGRSVMRGLEGSDWLEDSGVQGASPFSHHRICTHIYGHTWREGGRRARTHRESATGNS